jgi:hypothetical protein
MRHIYALPPRCQGRHGCGAGMWLVVEVVAAVVIIVECYGCGGEMTRSLVLICVLCIYVLYVFIWPKTVFIVFV